jgi:catechol 2,3-dioxygenase-like lactoylglutathione lyase family enzyme
MIKNIRHTGIVVKDLEKSLSFYKDFLGLKIFSEDREKGSFIEKLVGIDGVELKWVKLKTPDGNLVELLEYISHPYKSTGKDRSANKTGCPHLAFTVDDIDKFYADFKEKGYSSINPPALSPNGKVKVMYCYDPDEVILEFAEEIVSA